LLASTVRLDFAEQLKARYDDRNHKLAILLQKFAKGGTRSSSQTCDVLGMLVMMLSGLGIGQRIQGWQGVAIRIDNHSRTRTCANSTLR
jgi:hypothetical protein